MRLLDGAVVNAQNFIGLDFRLLSAILKAYQNDLYGLATTAGVYRRCIVTYPDAFRKQLIRYEERQ